MNQRNENTALLNDVPAAFEKLYIDLRSKEKRIYTDEEVAWLPEVSEDHIYRKEWEIRKASCKKLVRYLCRKKRPLKILEVGCGNGWLSYQLSQIRFSTVTGLDINLTELLQGERVFSAIPNLSFVYGDLASVSLNSQKLDIVVFAASIQYFRSFSHIIGSVLGRLDKNGEIHIIDSPFYSETEIGEAAERSRAYFDKMNFSEMNHFYFHHSLGEVEDFNYEILYDPNSVVNKVLRKKNPFHWICIRK